MTTEELELGAKIAHRNSGIFEVVDLDRHPVWWHLTIALLKRVGGDYKTILVTDDVLVNYTLV